VAHYVARLKLAEEVAREKDKDNKALFVTEELGHMEN